MKISLSWLQYYVDIDIPVQQLCDQMTMAGFEIEEVVDLRESMDRVVAAKILSITPHPDSDHLQICSVDIGADEPVQIVTGADNIFEGAMVPAALHDSHLPNGMHIKKGKLRGVASNGMLCSGEELCLKESDYPGAEVYGILILKEDVPVGADMRDVLHLNDYIIDFKITANRPDCNCVLGVAREIAAVLQKPCRIPEPVYQAAGGDIGEHVSVRVDNYELCPRYMGRVVTNLRIKESPDWMKRCLTAAGMRPINNIVDITNFVMLETGQPMHAFDLNDVQGRQIIVRNARPGEQITTLDGKAHTLQEQMLVICDSAAPSCIAGVMGGENSEIKETTTELFFESAKFKRDSVRRTARALGMRTESSARFEKGLDSITTAYAMERALQLVSDLDAGDIVGGVVDLYQELPQPRTLQVSMQTVNGLLGIEVPVQTAVDILNRLYIQTTADGQQLTCKIPLFREDIEGSADMAEEIVRIYGYDHIVGTVMRGDVVRGRLLPERIKTDRIKQTLAARGLHEIVTYSFIGSKAADLLGLAADDQRRQAISLCNPLGDEYSTMRTQLYTSMLTVLSTNYNRKNPVARLFEAGKIFIPKSLPLTEQPLEIPALSLGLYGEAESFFTLKGLVEDILELFGAKTELAPGGEPFLHPGRQAAVLLDGELVAIFGEVHPLTAEKFQIDTRVYLAQIMLPPLFALEQPAVQYKPLPKHPAVVRDLALLCDQTLPVGEIERAIRSAVPKLLEHLTLFDVYTGAQVESGKKSVAYSLTLRAADRTLTDEEVEHAVEKILKALGKIGVSLRQ